MQTFNGKKVVSIRDAKAGDPGFDVSKKQSRVELDDHSQATVLTSDVKTITVAPTAVPLVSSTAPPIHGVKPNLDPITEAPSAQPPIDPDMKKKIEASRNSPLETTRQLASKPDITAGRSE